MFVIMEIFSLSTDEPTLYIPSHSTIYSATTFLEKCRKVVQEIWFDKSGLKKVVNQKKKGFHTINPLFSGWRKVVDQKKNPSWQNHFSREVVAD